MCSLITHFNYIIVDSIWPLAISETKLENLKTAIFLSREPSLAQRLPWGGELGFGGVGEGFIFCRILLYSACIFLLPMCMY